MKKLKSIEGAKTDDESILAPLIDELKDKIDYVISGLEILEMDGKDNEAVEVVSSLLIEVERAERDVADILAKEDE